MLSMYFFYYVLLEKGMALHLNKLKSFLAKNALCHVWMKLASGSGENF